MQAAVRHASRQGLLLCCRRAHAQEACAALLLLQPGIARPAAVDALASSEACSRLCSASTFRSFFGNPFSSAPDAKTYEERRLVGYSPEQLFTVVSKVENYQDFVPFCVKSVITKQAKDGGFEAELEVGFQLFVERYTSKVTVKQPQLVRSEVSDHRLFDHLNTEWVMKPGPMPNSCWLSFTVDFEFRSPLYKHAAEVFFTEVVKQMMAAFEKRCNDMYGPSSVRCGATGKSTATSSA